MLNPMSPQPGIQNAARGFTLTELLITVAILGIISAFTIGKVLGGPSSDQKFKTEGKGALVEIQKAYTLYREDYAPLATTTFGAITPYMNYVKTDTTSSIDAYVGSSSAKSCSSPYACLLMHDGGLVRYNVTSDSFGSTATTQAMYVYFDPDGIYSNTTDGPGQSVMLYLYYDGAVKSTDQVRTGTYDQYGTVYNPHATRTYDPTWWNIN